MNMSRANTRLVRVFAAGLVLASLASMSGCLFASQDRYPYVSRTWSPKTVTLMDSRTGQELWRYELPVDMKMRIRFEKGDGDNREFPDVMRWDVRSTTGSSFKDEGRVPSPPEGVRRIDWYLRPGPEYPRLDPPSGEPAPLPEPAPEPTLEPEPVVDPEGS